MNDYDSLSVGDSVIVKKTSEKGIVIGQFSMYEFTGYHKDINRSFFTLIGEFEKNRVFLENELSITRIVIIEKSIYGKAKEV